MNKTPKPLVVTNVAEARQKISDLKVVGNGDMFALLCKASSESQGWMKSCKAMQVPGGCVVQVTTQNNGIPAEALTFVPNVEIAPDVNGGRKLVAIDRTPPPGEGPFVGLKEATSRVLERLQKVGTGSPSPETRNSALPDLPLIDVSARDQALAYQKRCVQLARDTAREAHAGKFRRDGVTPYFKHLEDVAARVGDSWEHQCVAWLHDILEDTRMTKLDLEDRGVPDFVIHAVWVLTKQPGEDYTHYIQGVRRNSLATHVKIHDMISNLADQPTASQIRKYAKALEYLTNPANTTYGS